MFPYNIMESCVAVKHFNVHTVITVNSPLKLKNALN